MLAAQLYDKNKRLTLADLEKADRYRNTPATKLEKGKVPYIIMLATHILRSVNLRRTFLTTSKKDLW